ncbi:hypothetical protein SVIO_052620 [Streptomyces violaceusniger]|uniref:HTH iclR-type domain-containing protein n=1 Tax=Streptomyces violaceusniger TaxID=68280 RepID=A0A4D4L9F7_STRVO|nr:hypothetical protein SVIO_052620 [Streptomyces violaceusniger]
MATSTLESGVGVLDKASLLLGVLEAGPASLSRLVSATGLKRPTVHRLVLALERLRLLARDTQGRFVLGPRLGLMAAKVRADHLAAVAEPVLCELRDQTGASARLFRRRGRTRVCVAEAVAPGNPAVRDRTPMGVPLPMNAGPVSQVLLAWERPEELYEGLRGAMFTASTLSGVRRQGWAHSVGGRSTASPRWRPRCVDPAAGWWPRCRSPGRRRGCPARRAGTWSARWSTRRCG